MSRTFNTIGLIGKYQDPGIADTLHAVHNYLRGRKLQVLLDADTAANMPGHGMATAPRAQIGERCDLAIVVGGDGTLLDAARSLSDFGIPLVGVNLGRLGFLADVSPADMVQQLDEILAGDSTEEERLLLHARVERDGEEIMAADALNDVVIHKWEVARMIEFETYVDGLFVHTSRSDGMIVSTPTGSTAYALSGGGPILHPSLDALVLVPICPHTLTSRPIVVSAGARIEVVVAPSLQGEGQVTCDGQINHRVEPGDRIVIEAKPRKLHLLHPRGYEYFRILRSKLRWSEQP
jgi:NAD+ kinase